jgi:hypothetical protein
VLVSSETPLAAHRRSELVELRLRAKANLRAPVVRRDVLEVRAVPVVRVPLRGRVGGCSRRSVAGGELLEDRGGLQALTGGRVYRGDPVEVSAIVALVTRLRGLES